MSQKSIDIINDADIVLFGSAPQKMVKKRIKDNKLIFRYSERIFKKKDFDLLRMMKYKFEYLPYRKKNLYFLCGGACVAKDYKRCGADVSKCYKWGYFPEVKTYEDVDALINKKEPSSILWVARFIDWKHPEVAVEVEKKLKNDG